jgi:glycosyltransferase involved in cell wall biosynthesis
MEGPVILLTTSDYFPKLGGLSTFTQNIESVLQELKLDYNLFHWTSYKDIQNLPESELAKYSLIINIHPQFSWFSNSGHRKMINFIHGSEILMTSPNLFKKIYKKINKYKYFDKIGRTYLNIFISEATLSKAESIGFKTDYSRDLVLHNCIDMKDAQFIHKEIQGKLSFSCIVRNVAHKNLSGSLKFCEFVALVTGREVELIVPNGSGLSSSKIEIRELIGADNIERDIAYKLSHYNLLLSQDHSNKGFFEGFGLTVLEAAKFGTPSIVMNSGGLPEAVHHGETGWVIDEISLETVQSIFSKENEKKYYQMAVDCFGHTLRSHSLQEYTKILEIISMQKGVA